MGVSEGVHGLEAVLLVLLVLVAGFAVMAQRVKTPYPIVLVVAGLVVSLVPHVPKIPLRPDVVFLVFLPPLLYASAWGTSWREFRHNLLPISMLAVGLVAFTVFGVALVCEHFVAALDWKSGFLLGAVVATTDAIAAASIASQVGLPARIVELLEGESLLNDATGLLALEFGVQMLQTGETPTLQAGLLRLLWLMGAGVGIGLLVGWVVAWFERYVDDGPVEMVVSLLVPYLAYLAGEEARASGVLAVVACGLYLSRKSAGFFSPEVRIQVMGGWETLNFALNGLVFLLIGLQLPYVLDGIRGDYGKWTLIRYGVLFSVVLIVLRLVWVFPASKVAQWVQGAVQRQRMPKQNQRAVFVVGWTGMRGVIALAAAFSLPETVGGERPFVQRPLIIFVTFVVILVTLVVQGLTLPTLIRWLGLGRKENRQEELEAREETLRAAIQYLEEQRAEQAAPELAHGFEDLLHRYQHRLDVTRSGLKASGTQAETEPDAVGVFRRVRQLSIGAVQAERQAAVRMRDEGAIGDGVLNRLLREMDLAEARQTAGD